MAAVHSKYIFDFRRVAGSPTSAGSKGAGMDEVEDCWFKALVEAAGGAPRRTAVRLQKSLCRIKCARGMGVGPGGRNKPVQVILFGSFL